MKALDAMGKLDDPYFGNIPPDETVDLCSISRTRGRAGSME